MTEPGGAPVVLVSACLLGCECRWDGRDAYCPEVERLVEGCRVVPVCPEELGGLPTPREPAEFDAQGRIVTGGGTDVSAFYIEGARKTLEIARAEGATRAILKGKSPSCGVSRVHRCGKLVPGAGVTAEALRRAGLEIREVE